METCFLLINSTTFSTYIYKIRAKMEENQINKAKMAVVLPKLNVSKCLVNITAILAEMHESLYFLMVLAHSTSPLPPLLLLPTIILASELPWSISLAKIFYVSGPNSPLTIDLASSST